jgi:hypothetical protein
LRGILAPTIHRTAMAIEFGAGDALDPHALTTPRSPLAS